MSRKFLSKPLVIFSFILAICLLLVFLNYKNLLGTPRQALTFVFSPATKLFQKTGAAITGSLNFVFTIGNLKNENNELHSQNASLQEQIIEFKEIVRENELLRAQLNIPGGERNDLIFAEVIGFDPLAGQYFIINKGERDGLKNSQAAVDANNFLVGKIFDVQESSAKVLLLTDALCVVNALSQDSRINGVTKGEHGLDIAMDMVSLDKQLNKGKPIITSGLDGLIPKGILIGWMEETKNKENEVFQKIKIRPAADFKNLENVFVIIK